MYNSITLAICKGVTHNIINITSINERIDAFRMNIKIKKVTIYILQPKAKMALCEDTTNENRSKLIKFVYSRHMTVSYTSFFPVRSTKNLGLARRNDVQVN